MSSQRFFGAMALLGALFGVSAAEAQEVLFGVTFDEELIRIDPATGAGTLVGPLGFTADSLGISTFNGELFILDQTQDRLVVVNPFTAATIRTIPVIDPDGNVFSEGDLEIAANGQGFYCESDRRLRGVNITTGAGSFITDSFPLNVDGLAFASNGTFYAISSDGSFYTANPNTGATTLLGTGVVSGGTGGLDFRSDGVLFAAFNRTLYQVNPANGATTVIGDTGLDFISGITFMVIPEPSMLGLLTMCATGLLRRTRA